MTHDRIGTWVCQSNFGFLKPSPSNVLTRQDSMISDIVLHFQQVQEFSRILIDGRPEMTASAEFDVFSSGDMDDKSSTRFMFSIESKISIKKQGIGAPMISLFRLCTSPSCT